MLPRNQRQEALSRAYVRTVAARAGVLCTETHQDFGIDLFLRTVSHRDGQYRDTGPQLDVQLKSTTQALMRETGVVYDLDVRAYHLLREPIVGGLRILVLLVLPEDETQWTTQTVAEFIVRRCAYWFSLNGAEPTTSHTTHRITIPHTNVFSPEAVAALMNSLKEEGTA